MDASKAPLGAHWRPFAVRSLPDCPSKSLADLKGYSFRETGTRVPSFLLPKTKLGARTYKVWPVAVADRVYVAAEGWLMALDAATGQTVTNVAPVKAPRELLVQDGLLVVADRDAVRAAPRRSWTGSAFSAPTMAGCIASVWTTASSPGNSAPRPATRACRPTVNWNRPGPSRAAFSSRAALPIVLPGATRAQAGPACGGVAGRNGGSGVGAFVERAGVAEWYGMPLPTHTIARSASAVTTNAPTTNAVPRQ
jgi:hypothetical protein